MNSTKCPACGLVAWDDGEGADCKRCGAPPAAPDAPPQGFNYAPPQGFNYYDAPAENAHGGRGALAVCAQAAVLLTLLAAVTLGVLYVAHRPKKPQWFWSFYRDNPTVAEIFAHNLEVSGGVARLARIRGFRAAGVVRYRGGAAARAVGPMRDRVKFVVHVKAPDKVEMEVEIGAVGGGEEKADDPLYGRRFSLLPRAPAVQVNLRRGFNGTRGWEYAERLILTPGSTVPIKQHSTRELEGAELEQVKISAKTTTGLVRLGDEYTSLAFAGRQVVGWPAENTSDFTEVATARSMEHDAYVVRGVNRRGRNETLYFDAVTGLLVRVDFVADAPGGGTVDVECYPDDYREVEGVSFPHTLRYRQGDERFTLDFKEYVPNDPIPDSTFEPPE